MTEKYLSRFKYRRNAPRLFRLISTWATFSFFSVLGVRNWKAQNGHKKESEIQHNTLLTTTHGSSQDFFGGEHFFKKFSKICKEIFKNLVKIFKIFQKRFSKNFQKYSSETYKNFAKKIAKNGFLSIFFTKFHKPSIHFLRVWTKNAICSKFLRKFWKNFLRKLQRMHYLTYFSKELNKSFVNFLRDWTKNTIRWKFRENFLKKIAKNAWF